MGTTRQSLGHWGETLAARHLQQQGYKIIERNLRTPYGEIDIIAQTGDTLVFVEVKTRTTNAYGLPEASVTPQKQAHIIAAVQAYLQTKPHLQLDWRIDVIAIRKIKTLKEPEIVHFKNAVT